MPHTKFPVEVLTPDGEVFSDEVEQISTKTAVGSIGILAGHEPVLAMLEPTELRLYKSDSEVVRFAQAEGYMQIAEGRALLLVEEAHSPSELDADQLRDRLQQAERELDEAGDDTERRRNALRDKDRWETFLGVASQ
jgi:F-type H+-transporting ATPase subunit epsilon